MGHLFITIIYSSVPRCETDCNTFLNYRMNNIYPALSREILTVSMNVILPFEICVWFRHINMNSFIFHYPMCLIDRKLSDIVIQYSLS